VFVHVPIFRHSATLFKLSVGSARRSPRLITVIDGSIRIWRGTSNRLSAAALYVNLKDRPLPTRVFLFLTQRRRALLNADEETFSLFRGCNANP
jgi:hypothetical protein